MPWKYLKDCDCGCDNVNSDNVTYYGPNLPCTGIEKDDSISLALAKIDEAICHITGVITTTTSTSTTTTTTLPSCYYWQANITQSGTNAPVVSVIDTNFPAIYTITSLYAGVGQYFITFNDLPFNFVDANTMILTGSVPYNYTKLYAQVAGVRSTDFYFETRDVLSNSLIDGILQNTSVHLKYCLEPPSLRTTSTTTTISTAPKRTLVYPVRQACCGVDVATEYVVFNENLHMGQIINSVSNGYLGGYIVTGPQLMEVPTIVALNDDVFNDCLEWSNYWASLACM